MGRLLWMVMFVAGCGDNRSEPIDAVDVPIDAPAPPITVIVTEGGATVFFQDPNGRTVQQTTAGYALGDLPSGGTVIAVAPPRPCDTEGHCGLFFWVVRGVRPGDQVTTGPFDSSTPDIEVVPSPSSGSVVTCGGTWGLGNRGSMQVVIKMLVLWSSPRSLPMLPDEDAASDPSRHGIGCNG